MSVEMGSEPTVERIVHYKAPANDEFPPRTLAALITGVHENREVDLCCFGPRGLGFREHIKQGEVDSTWNWPLLV